MRVRLTLCVEVDADDIETAREMLDDAASEVATAAETDLGREAADLADALLDAVDTAAEVDDA